MFLKFCSWVVFVGMLVPLARGQGKKAEAEGEPVSLPLTTTLARDYPVITVPSPCPKSASKPGGCNTVVTREEFEDLVKAINPRMIKLERHQLAQNYGKMLALENEALREGLDKKPEMRALLRYMRASALGGGAYKQTVREASDNPGEAVEKFYKANQASYDRYNLQRLFIPLAKPHRQSASMETIGTEDDASAATQEMKALAEKMQARAAAGEDFVALQKEVFAQAGIQADPKVAVEDVMRGTLSAEQNQAFDLPQGKVSPVIADATGYFVYKMVSKRTPEFAAVKEQVAIEMANKRIAAELKRIENAKINETYFDKYDAPPPDPNEPEVDDD
jgi:hypothetical protein